MALVDTLDYFPQKHPQRAELIATLNRVARAVAKYQDARSGLWDQVLDKGEKVVTNDPKGIGAFLLASTEMEARTVRRRSSEALQ